MNVSDIKHLKVRLDFLKDQIKQTERRIEELEWYFGDK